MSLWASGKKMHKSLLWFKISYRYSWVQFHTLSIKLLLCNKYLYNTNRIKKKINQTVYKCSFHSFRKPYNLVFTHFHPRIIDMFYILFPILKLLNNLKPKRTFCYINEVNISLICVLLLDQRNVIIIIFYLLNRM